MQILDILNFPLAGRSLIEASAGTGKTFTIANLYLRMLIERQLTVRQILVVTFTQAATEELRGRIRAKLIEARHAFVLGKSEDVLLAKMLKECQDQKKTIAHLEAAQSCLDEMSIFTIHGFCQRMLQEHAFESGALFKQTLLQEESELLEEAVQDYWRSQFYPAQPYLVSLVTERWHNPETLRKEIHPYFNKPQLRFLPTLRQGNSDQLLTLHLALDQANQAFSGLQTLWQQQQEKIKDLLLQHPGLKRNLYRKDKLHGLLRLLERFLSAKTLTSLPENFERFTSRVIKENVKGSSGPEHPFFEQCSRLEHFVKAIPDLIIREALSYCRQAVKNKKRQQSLIGFDDLLLMLNEALRNDPNSKLAKKIRSQFPVAMIDEFQDTDPTQYAVFNAVYPKSAAGCLVMIGDPKQSIYGFRGADVFTYIQAKQDVDPDQIYTLGTNWRSTSAMVAAVNRLFGEAADPFVFAQIPYFAVQSSGVRDDEQFMQEGAVVPPVQVGFISRTDNNTLTKTVEDPFAQSGHSKKRELIKKRDAEHLVSRWTAEKILGLLNQSAAIGKQPVRPHHIAILVQSRFQAEKIQQALRDAGISSVFYSRNSVYETREAKDLLFLLRAIATPGDERLMKAGLATEIMGLTAEQLDSLSKDNQYFDQWLQTFDGYRELWLKKSFMAMFLRLLHEQHISQRLLASPSGERKITNLLHLAETLQKASSTLVGLHGLIQWFYERQYFLDADEEQQLRLESDEALVKIVTIHKSKGLQYDIVFAPFVWNCRKTDSNKPLLFHRGVPCVDLRPNNKKRNYHVAEQERLAEDLRLLYVAITRAKYRCYLAWGQVDGAQFSALAYLLYQPTGRFVQQRVPPIMGAMTDRELQNHLSDLAGQGNLFDYEVIHESGSTTGSLSQWKIHSAPGTSPANYRKLQRTIDRSWRLASFSALVTSSGSQWHELPDHDALQQPEAQNSTPAFHSIMEFPKGARAGTFMHSVFESIDFTEPSQQAIDRVIVEQLHRYGFEPEWLPVISDMVAQVLSAPLQAGSDLRLKHISNRQRLVEMEFHFPVSPLRAAVLNRLIERYYPSHSTHPNQPSQASEPSHSSRAALDFELAKGMMKGFIDLIFSYEGRFYVADYKSNHLGDSLEDYDTAALQEAIDHHRYDLQYLIYSLALHRYLKQRLPAYRYERHFGGVCYLFLRGIRPTQNPKTGIFTDRPSSALITELDELFNGNQ